MTKLPVEGRSPLALWAGVESSHVRVGDAYVDELDLTGHASRPADLERIAALGATAVRYPVLWERTAPDAGAPGDWTFADERLGRLRELGLQPIIGLVHHGSGPRQTNLLDPSFVTGLATFARRVAERYPWVRDYTPVNEPLTTARFSALYGHWYPHARDARSFLRAVFHQCCATRAAMRAIREVVPDARLVQTEDLGTIYATPRLAYQARFENDRRLLSLDFLTGRFRDDHPLWRWVVDHGLSPAELDGLIRDPIPPDVVGLNHYVTSDRFLDHRVASYPAAVRGGNAFEPYADVEAVRARRAGIAGFRPLLELLWDRYRLPLAITEVHLGCASEEQIRWLLEAWNSAEEARAVGVDVQAVTVWSLFGACDWDSLLTRPRGHYEAGAFDVGGGVVRPTALATVARELATSGESTHPLIHEPGWWSRDTRLVHRADDEPSSRRSRTTMAPCARPLLVAGASGTLGRALVRACNERQIAFVALGRSDLDILDPAAIRRVLDQVRPWAVVNASGYVRVDDAETDRERCFAVNVDGAVALAEACASRRIRQAMFSSDLVFDGVKGAPYVEDDGTAPLNVYGASKERAEVCIRAIDPTALGVRTSAFFGPWDSANFVHHALSTLREGRHFVAAADQVVTPTYVPDLAQAVLTLLIDGADGIWHLASAGPGVSWADLARRAATEAGLPADRVRAVASAELRLPAPRPAYSTLASTKGQLLGPLDEALALYVRAWSDASLAAAE